MREKHALKSNAAEAHAQPQVLAAADWRYSIELCALDAHERLGVAAAVGFELLKRAHAVHVER